MRYEFLVETYETERIKVLSVWSEFRDEDLPMRPRADDPRGRSVRGQLVHQCVSEDLWFRTMLGIDVSAAPLPAQETRLDFIKRYGEDSAKRLQALKEKPESWFEGETKFFDVARARAWVLTRRLTHTSHHCCKASHAAERRLTCPHPPAELSPSDRTLVSGRGAFCMHSKSAAKVPHSK